MSFYFGFLLVRIGLMIIKEVKLIFFHYFGVGFLELRNVIFICVPISWDPSDISDIVHTLYFSDNDSSCLM